MAFAAAVVDESRRNQLPTGRVTLRVTEDNLPDSYLAGAAGYDLSRHYGYAIRRHDDSDTVVVELHND